MGPFSGDPYEVFRDDLRPGERLLWTGQPDPGKLLSPSDLFVIPFSLFWGGFAFFWEAMAIGAFLKEGGRGPVVIMPIFGIPFCLVGAYMIFGRFIVLANQRRRTYYGLTDQRLLFVTLGRQRNSQYVTIDRDLTVQKSIRPDGSGSLVFSDKRIPNWAGQLMLRNRSSETIAPTFSEIRDAAEVAALIDRQVSGLKVEASVAAANG